MSKERSASDTTGTEVPQVRVGPGNYLCCDHPNYSLTKPDYPTSLYYTSEVYVAVGL